MKQAGGQGEDGALSTNQTTLLQRAAGTESSTDTGITVREDQVKVTESQLFGEGNRKLHRYIFTCVVTKAGARLTAVHSLVDSSAVSQKQANLTKRTCFISHNVIAKVGNIFRGFVAHDRCFIAHAALQRRAMVNGWFGLLDRWNSRSSVNHLVRNFYPSPIAKIHIVTQT